MGLARDPRRGSRRHGSLGRRGVGLSWFASGLLGISHFDWVGMSSFLFFAMFDKWMMWQIISGCCKRGGLQCNLTIGALINKMYK
jgi:hypothetical protein